MASDSRQAVSGATQDVAYAGFWARFAALLVDTAIIFIIGIAISIASALAGAAALVIGQIVFFLVYLLYWPVMESSARQATFGKSLLGIQVTDLDGGRLSFLRALLRNIAKIISAIPLYIGFVLAAFTKRKQALHDMITKCLVVRTGPSHFGRALAAGVGGLVIAIGSGAAYFYYVAMPKMQDQTARALQEATKGAPPRKAMPASPAVAKRPMPAPTATKLSPPTPEGSTATAAGPTGGSPAAPAAMTAAREPAKSAPSAQTSVPEKSLAAVPPPARIAKIRSEPSARAPRRRVAPPATLPAAAPAVAAAPAAEPRIITPKFNDVMTAVIYGDEDAVKQLLDLGWWVDKPSSVGYTPLMAAVMRRNARMVQLLLAHGADPNAGGPGGVTALALAHERNDRATAALLEQRSAR